MLNINKKKKNTSSPLWKLERFLRTKGFIKCWSVATATERIFVLLFSIDRFLSNFATLILSNFLWKRSPFWLRITHWLSLLNYKNIDNTLAKWRRYLVTNFLDFPTIFDNSLTLLNWSYYKIHCLKLLIHWQGNRITNRYYWL